MPEKLYQYDKLTDSIHDFLQSPQNIDQSHVFVEKLNQYFLNGGHVECDFAKCYLENFLLRTSDALDDRVLQGLEHCMHWTYVLVIDHKLTPEVQNNILALLNLIKNYILVMRHAANAPDFHRALDRQDIAKLAIKKQQQA